MNLPCQFPYNPSWRLLRILLVEAVLVLALIGAQFIFDGHLTTYLVWIGIIPPAACLLLLVRRFFLKRYIELNEGSLRAPSGFGRLRYKEFPYGSIQNMRQFSIVGMPVLSVATTHGKFEVVSGMLSDWRTYVEIAEFLHSCVVANQKNGGDD